jgi:hypothetical protein
MTGSETMTENVTLKTNITGADGPVDLSRVDIDALVARAARLRGEECGRLFRRAWLTLSSLWRGPRRVVPPASRRHATAA